MLQLLDRDAEPTLVGEAVERDFQGADHAQPVAHALVVRVGVPRLGDGAIEDEQGLAQPATMGQSLVGMFGQPSDGLGVGGIRFFAFSSRSEHCSEVDQQFEFALGPPGQGRPPV